MNEFCDADRLNDDTVIIPFISIWYIKWFSKNLEYLWNITIQKA